ncbi:signal peptidase I [Apilactobacillus xinyiensis]|uniref:signal peptidase I n=1 Tax=Apilactobacillus xinyiensis TaxID=2841032 RepID=UPI00200F8B0F|nr:signal peptidase I [Apilactobacillus xinyiensis]MCL0330185.1 signal peptidase I [Apilactobacillus xinyiensis]
MSFIKSVLGYVIPIIVGLLIALVVRSTLFTVAKVQGTSMQPNLENNQRVMVLKKAQIKHLSVVIFSADGVDPDEVGSGNYYVKRVIGLPGDTVDYKDGNIYVNGKKINQSFINAYQRSVGTGTVQGYQEDSNWDIKKLSSHWKYNHGAVKVPKNSYFVLGDHRSVSNDSRYWGFVPKDKIMGVAKTFPLLGSSTKRHNVNDLAY